MAADGESVPALGATPAEGQKSGVQEVKSLVELSAVVVAWNYNENSPAMPAEIVECLQKRMKSWRQKRYFREYKEWYPNGQIAWYESYNEEGTKEGPCKQWYEDGTPKLLCHYKNGVLHGEWKQWFEDGVMWNHRFYKDGEIHGEAKSWDEKGVLKSQGFYKDGKRHGEYRAWRKDNQLMSHSHFKDGLRHGECKHWWGNGRLYLLMSYKNGVKHGEWKEWRKSGQLKIDEFYVDGKKQPPWQRPLVHSDRLAEEALLFRIAVGILLLQLILALLYTICT